MYAKDRMTVVDRREMLRVKLKSLAEESKIIRQEERRTFGILLGELHAHRVLQVRSEARHTHIAYGLIRGRPYERIEKPLKAPSWDKVKAMIKRYGPADASQALTLLKGVEALGSVPA